MPMALRISYWITVAGFYGLMVYSGRLAVNYFPMGWFFDTITFLGFMSIFYFTVIKFWTTLEKL